MQTFEVWRSGYRITGNADTAKCLGTVLADDFQHACDLVLDGDRYYDSERLTWWGCKLHDNEADARKSFG